MKEYFAWFFYDFFKNSQEKCQINYLGKLVFKIKPLKEHAMIKLFLSLASLFGVINLKLTLSFLAKLFFKNKLFILE